MKTKKMYCYTRDDALESVGRGWASLVNEFFNNKSDKCCVSQVKEKFGGLRIYHYFGSDADDDLIERLERKSYTVCEVCGKGGKPTKVGWIKTLCEEHTNNTPAWHEYKG